MEDLFIYLAYGIGALTRKPFNKNKTLKELIDPKFKMNVVLNFFIGLVFYILLLIILNKTLWSNKP